MRAIRWLALILWVAGASYLWFRISPLAPNVVIRHDPLGSVVHISRDGLIVTYRVVKVDDEYDTTGPFSWYDHRTGRLIKTVGSDRVTGMWSVESGRPPIITASEDQKRVLVDMWTGRVLVHLPDGADDQSYNVSPDGRYLAWIADGEARVMEVATARPVLKHPARNLAGFIGTEIFCIEQFADATDTRKTRLVSLSLPDGAVVEPDAPSTTHALLSPRGDLMVRTVEGLQAGVCDSRTGKVLWKTAISIPNIGISSDKYRFNATGDELLANYGDEQWRPRFARWRAKDGQVIAPMPTTFGTREYNSVDFDPTTGATTMRTHTMNSFDNHDGWIVSTDGQYIVQRVESQSELRRALISGLETLEGWCGLPLSSLSDSLEDSSLAVFDMTTERRIGTVRSGDVKTPSDASWFAVDDLNSVRIYSAPFQADWMSLAIWALVPPIGVVALTRLMRLAVSWWRRRGSGHR